jgi:hypothetical protein
MHGTCRSSSALFLIALLPAFPYYVKVLEVLEEIAFKPQFLGSRIEKERRAVLAEAQMMNTIEYRVDCQLLRVRAITLDSLFIPFSESFHPLLPFLALTEFFYLAIPISPTVPA